MATRGTIAIELADGTVKQIYSHWDNYLSYNGQMLQDYYTDPVKVQSLVDGGSISSLAPSIEQPAGHSFEKAVEGYTVFYARDRGEELHINKFSDFETYHLNAEREDYNYILRADGKWYVAKYNGTFQLLEAALAAQLATDSAFAD